MLRLQALTYEAKRRVLETSRKVITPGLPVIKQVTAFIPEPIGRSLRNAGQKDIP